MNSAENRIENQVQFWSLLGPFLFLGSISVLVLKLSLHWYFPLCIMIGLPLCVKWKIKGMACALTLLFAVTLFAYPNLNLDERYWHVGMALAMAFSFIIFTLCLEEVEGVLTKLQLESKSRLENFLKLDDSTKRSEDIWNEEKATFNEQILTLHNELAIATKDKEIFYKLSQLAKDELIQIRMQHELLQQDLTYKKHQIYQLNEKLEESEIALQSLIDTDPEQKVQELKNDLEKSKELEIELQKEINTLQKSLTIVEQASREHCTQFDELKVQHQRDLAQIIREKEMLITAQSDFENRCQEIEKEKLEIANSLKELKFDYETLLLSENQCKEVLSHSESKVSILTKELEAAKQIETSLTVQLSNIQKGLREIQSQNEELNSQCVRLKLIESNFANEQKFFAQEKASLVESKEKLQEELANLRLDKSRIAEELEKSKLEYEKIVESESHALKLIADNKTHLDVLLNEIEMAKKIENACQIQIQRLEQDFVHTRAENEDLQQQLSELKKNCANCENERDLLIKENQIIKEKLEYTETEKQCYVEVLEAKNQEYEKISSSETYLQVLLKNYETQLNDLTQDIEKSKQLEMSCKTQIHELERCVNQSQNENDILASLIKELEEREKKHTDTQNQIEQERTQLINIQKKLQQQLEVAQQEKLTLDESLKALKHQLREAEDSKEKNNCELFENEKILKQYEHELSTLHLTKNELENQVINIKNDHVLETSKLQLHLDQLKDDLLKQAKEKQAMQGEFERLLQEKDLIVNDLNEKLTINNDPVNHNLGVNSHKFESLYLQLRQQFQEKSEVLDQTRQELFIAHEKVMVLQKTMEEQEVFSVSESEKILEHAYKSLIQEYETMRSEYENELEHLQAIIDRLVTNLSSE